MGWNPKPVRNRSQVIRIEMLEAPEHREVGQGEYELKYADKPKEPIYHDIMSLLRFLTKIWPEQAEHILDRLQNFRKVFINLDTGEITS